MARAIWICGTSASISSGCYSDFLRDLLPNINIRNISVGDQTSIMGLMRIHQYAGDIKPGDIVVWEYALLDDVLSPFYDRRTVFSAMKQAWLIVMQRGATVLLLVTPSRSNATPSHIEEEIIGTALYCGVPLLTLRDLLLPHEKLEDLYRDDRHPDERGELPSRTARQLASMLGATEPQRPPPVEKFWRWIGAAELVAAGAEYVSYENRLLETASARINPGDWIPIPDEARIVSIGIVSKPDSGAVWCGHQPCAPASCRPEATGFAFLLRSTRLPCVHGTVGRLFARPDYWPMASWQDYGQSPANELAPVDLIGVLVE